MKVDYFDRGGTLIEYIGFLKNPFNINFSTGAFSLVVLLHKQYCLHVVTYKSGIAEWLTSSWGFEVVKSIIELYMANGYKHFREFKRVTLCMPGRSDE